MHVNEASPVSPSEYICWYSGNQLVQAFSEFQNDPVATDTWDKLMMAMLRYQQAQQMSKQGPDVQLRVQQGLDKIIRDVMLTGRTFEEELVEEARHTVYRNAHRPGTTEF